MTFLVSAAWAQAEMEEGGTTWREDYAYAMGVANLPYLYPYYRMANKRYDRTMVEKKSDRIPYAPTNQFWHQRHLSNHELKGVGASNDTIYSTAWVSVENEPVILSHPDMGERYFTFQMAAMSSDNFAYVGARTTGTKAKSVAIVSPHYQGKLPKEITRVITAPTPWFFIVGRTLVDSEADLIVARAFQDQYKLMPLSQWLGHGKPKPITPWKPITPKDDVLGFWRTTARAIAENPPSASEDGIHSMLKAVGLGPDGDIDALDEGSKRGLARAYVDGMAIMRAGLMSPPSNASNDRNGWRVTSKEHGRLGTAGLFLDRGMTQSMRGFVANDAAEATYFSIATDGKGRELSGKNTYEVHFSKEPPTEAFWSLTVYDEHASLIENAIDRYSRGDRSGLKYDANGGVTLYLQTQDPGGDKSRNWLPIPNDRPFFLGIRVYIPKMDVLNGDWVPGSVVKQGKLNLTVNN